MAAPERRTSATLLERVRDPGDTEAWERFFELYAPLLERYARASGLTPEDAEEVRDQCLAVLARKLPGFEYDRKKGGFQGWLHRIARGKVVDLLRRPGSRNAETHQLSALVDPQPGPDAVWELSWREEHLRFGLEAVRKKESERTVRAFELLLLEGLSVPEVCARTGMNANQVYKAKARCLRRVREVLERLGVEPGGPA